MKQRPIVEIIDGTKIVTHPHNNKAAELKERMKKIRAARAGKKAKSEKV